MSDQENWVSLPQAVAIVKAAAGSSQGPAQRTLIAICESGGVRARWTGHYSKTRPAIHKRDWIGADIDWANFRVVKADGAGMADVDFSEDDLRSSVRSLSIDAIKVANAESEEADETPVVSKPSGVQTSRQAKLRAKCVAWIKMLPEKPAPAKEDAKAEAMKVIEGLSGRQFYGAWDEAAPVAWKRPGPK
jgi:hypothetical protein